MLVHSHPPLPLRATCHFFHRFFSVFIRATILANFSRAYFLFLSLPRALTLSRCVVSHSFFSSSARYCTDYVFSFAHFPFSTPTAVLRTPPFSKRSVMPYRKGDKSNGAHHSRGCALWPSRCSLVKHVQPRSSVTLGVLRSFHPRQKGGVDSFHVQILSFLHLNIDKIHNAAPMLTTAAAHACIHGERPGARPGQQLREQYLLDVWGAPTCLE